MKPMTGLMLIALSMLVLCTGYAMAGSVSIPTKFEPNTPAKAGEVNDNFDAAADAINDNDSRISSNTTAIGSKQNRVSDECPAGESIRAIAEDGTVACEVDDTGVAPPTSGIEFFDSIKNITNVPTSITSAGSIAVTTPADGPSKGYILVQVSGRGVVLGEGTLGIVGIGDTATVMDFRVFFGVQQGTADYNYEFPINVMGVYEVGPGTTKTFHLLAQKWSGAQLHQVWTVELYMTAVYFPKRY